VPHERTASSRCGDRNSAGAPSRTSCTGVGTVIAPPRAPSGTPRPGGRPAGPSRNRPRTGARPARRRARARGRGGHRLQRDHAERLVPRRHHREPRPGEQPPLRLAGDPAREPDPLRQAQPLHLAAHPVLVRAAARDHQVALDHPVHLRPRGQEQVKALAAVLQPADVDDVAPGARRHRERRPLDPVADHLDLRRRVERAQPLGRALRDGDQQAMAAHPDPLQDVQRQLVLAALVPGVQPLDHPDRRAAGPARRGHRRERREEVLDDEVGGQLAGREREAPHVAEQPGPLVSPAARADVQVGHAVLDAVDAAGEPGGQHGDVVPAGGQPSVDLVRADRSAARAGHGRILEPQVEHPHRPHPLPRAAAMRPA